MRAIVAAVALALLTGCGGGDDGGAEDDGEARPQSRATETAEKAAEKPTPKPTPEEQIEATLDKRAAALQGGKPGAYVATSIPARRKLDRRVARIASRLKLRDVWYEAGGISVDGRRARAQVSFGYAVKGVNSQYEFERRVRLRRVGGSWRYVGTNARRGLPPWEVGKFRERRSKHFVVHAPPHVPTGELITTLEDGYSTMRRLLNKSRLRDRYLVVIADGPSEARKLTVKVRSAKALAAVAEANVVHSGMAERTTEVKALRLLIVWEAFENFDSLNRGIVAVHELTHAALTGTASGRVPSWLSEGVAMYISKERWPAPSGVTLAELSQPDAIGRLLGDKQARAYQLSSAAAFAIADRFGPKKLIKLHDSFNSGKLRGTPGRKLVDRALKRNLGISLAELSASL
jgi:hypothetical protein